MKESEARVQKNNDNKPVLSANIGCVLESVIYNENERILSKYQRCIFQCKDT